MRLQSRLWAGLGLGCSLLACALDEDSSETHQPNAVCGFCLDSDLNKLSLENKTKQPWLGGSVGWSIVPYTKRLWI